MYTNLASRFTGRLKRALRYSTIEGIAYGGMVGSGEYFTSAYAVALGASNRQMGFLAAAPRLLSAVTLMLSGQLAELLRSRKRVVLLFAVFQALSWLPIMAVGLVLKAHQVPLLIAFVALYVAFGALTIPPWGSIMAEVVPPRIRGRYFGVRSRWATLATMATVLLAGSVLFFMKGQPFWGFGLIFGAALLFRLASVGLLTTLPEQPHQPKEDEQTSPWAFIRSLGTTNLGRVMLYLFAVNFGVNLGGPFFTPYMLRELRMGYLTYTALEVVVPIATLWAVTHWGAAADRVGNRRMLLAAGVMISLVPLLWLVSGNVVYLGFAQLYGGVAWAGFNLVSTNFLYDATTSRNRTAYLGYYSAGANIAISLGAVTGGLVVNYMPPLMGSRILAMFLLSGCFRLLPVLFLWRLTGEVRRVTRLPASEVFYIMLGGRPFTRHPGHGRLPLHLHGHHNGNNHEANSDHHVGPFHWGKKE